MSSSTSFSTLELEATKTFCIFLKNQNIRPLSEPSNTLKTAAIGLLKTYIDCHFHLFKENTMRSIVTEALNYREEITKKSKDNNKEINNNMEDIFGSWNLIIETVKEIIKLRQEISINNLKELLKYGKEGESLIINKLLENFYSSGYLDYIFLDLLLKTKDECENILKIKSEKEIEQILSPQGWNYSDEFYFLTYCLNYIHSNLITTSKDKKNLFIKPLNFVNLLNLIKVSMTESQDGPSISKISPVTSTSSTTVASTSPSQADPDVIFKIKVSEHLHKLIKESNGNFEVLQNELKIFYYNNFDTEKKEKNEGNDNLPTPHTLHLFYETLEDNILACKQAGFSNKEKLLLNVKSFIKKLNEPVNIETDLENKFNEEFKSSTYHAPQFVQSRKRKNSISTDLDDDDDEDDDEDNDRNEEVIKINELLSAKKLYESQLQENKNKKKKIFKKKTKSILNQLCQEVSKSLNENRWAAIDNFVPLELVHKVRLESSIFRDHFEQSEIWVGKSSHIGAHLQVNEVRGDKVLWVCGGHGKISTSHEIEKKEKNIEEEEEDDDHDGENEDGEEIEEILSPGVQATEKLNNKEKKTIEKVKKASLKMNSISASKVLAPESNDYSMKDEDLKVDYGGSRHVTTYGDVEPCKLSVKASAPNKKFTGLKELLNRIDQFIDTLCWYNEDLHGVYERSDAMLAVYPGEGSRFANHIDNTTGDGRRITVLVYLNPEWKEEYGGALRITQRVQNDEEEDKIIDIFPHACRLAIFYSSEIPHEVRPCYKDRHAITLWYYDKTERANALRLAREQHAKSMSSPLSNSTEVSTIGSASAPLVSNGNFSTKSRLEAKNFINDLVGKQSKTEEEEGKESKIRGVDEEELAELNKKVQALSAEAAEIVASIITNVPTNSNGKTPGEVMKEAFPYLTQKDINKMRKRFRYMGLK